MKANSTGSFYKNSLVFTPDGLKNISLIRENDFVLNKEGRFCEVLKNNKTYNKLIYIKGHGHPKLTTTKGQNVLATDYKRIWNKKKGISERKFNKKRWINAEEMKGMFWASPINFPEIKAPIDLNKDISWFIGAYLGSGAIRYGRELYFKTNDFRYKKLEQVLKNLNLRHKKKRLEAFTEYFIYHAVITDWLKRVFHGRYNIKVVPFWIYGMDKKYRQNLFEGYVWARGVFEDGKYRFSTKNKHIAIAMKLIAQSLGYSVALYVNTSKKKNRITERWQIVAETSARSSAVVGNERLGLVREIIFGRKQQSVYSLELKNSNNYIVDGIIVKSG